ncbi:AAA family ATPase [Candidatus Dependentiae bacterium]
MVYSKNKSIACFCFSMLFLLTAFPTQGMDYQKIFNQKEILSKYPDLLKKEGLKPVKFDQKIENSKKGVFQKISNIKFRNIINFLCFGCFRRTRKKNFDCKTLKTSEELDKALVSDYKTKKFSCRKYELKKSLFFMAVETTIYGLGFKKINQKVISGVSGFLLANRLISHVKDIIIPLYDLYIAPLKKGCGKYEVIYAKNKRFFPESLQDSIERKFKAISGEQFYNNAETFCQIVLNIPLKSKKLKPALMSNPKVSKLLNGYDKNISEKIIIKFFNHYARFSKKIAPLDTPKTVLYLQGPPGVGKTFLTEEFANIMEAPLIKLKATDDIKDIVGTNNEPGSLLNSICKSGTTKNSIILIDEVDHVLNKKNYSLQFFLPFLEPETKNFYSPYLRSDVDISHFCFVLCGNSEIENKAIKSRTTIVVIDDLKKEAKKKIAYKMLDEKMKKNKPLMKYMNNLIDKYDQKGVRKLREYVNNGIRKFEMEDLEKKGSIKNNKKK